MNVKDIFVAAALGMVFYPLICIIFSTCVEIWFNRKEKHLLWCGYTGARKKKERNENNEQV